MAQSEMASGITAEKTPEKEVSSSTVQEASDHSSSGNVSCVEEPEYPVGIKLFTILISLGISIFLVALVSFLNANGSCIRLTESLPPLKDNTIIGTAIPKITDHFGALNDVGWYGEYLSMSFLSLSSF
jgi:hypothetical protein